MEKILHMKINIFILILLGSLTGCGGVNTTKPVYEGLLPTSAVPNKSEKKASDIKSAPNVVVVLSASSRGTAEGFKNSQSGIKWPVERWIAQIVHPIKQLNPNVRISQDLQSKSPESWVMVVHWIRILKPFMVGAIVEYRMLDSKLNEVAVYRAEETKSCDSSSLDEKELQNHWVQCYDNLLTNIINKASEPMRSL